MDLRKKGIKREKKRRNLNNDVGVQISAESEKVEKSKKNFKEKGKDIERKERKEKNKK